MSKSCSTEYTFKDLVEEVIEEAKISDLMKKPAHLLTQSEKNRLAKFKYNLANRESNTRPPYSKGEEAYEKHKKKYKDVGDKVEDKVKKAGGQLGVIASHNGYYR